MKDIKDLILNFHLSRILKCDEMGWKLFPKSILTWSENGKAHLYIQSQTGDKDQIAVLSTVSAAKVKRRLLFIAEGKTQNVEGSQIGVVLDYWSTHS